MIEDDGGGIWALPDKASHFVGGEKECPTKIVGVVDDGDFLRDIRHEEETKDLVEPPHFYVKICLEVHHASETGDVLVAGLVH
jgi:hypothetical protein